MEEMYGSRDHRLIGEEMPFLPHFFPSSLRPVSQQLKRLIKIALDREVKRGTNPPGHFEASAWERSEWAKLFRMVGSLTYKPGWAFEIVSFFQTDCPVLKVTVHLEDAWLPDQYATGRFFFPANPMILEDESYILLFIKDCIKNVEDHETGEWIKIDGEAPFFPHKPGTGEVIYDLRIYPDWRNRRKQRT